MKTFIINNWDIINPILWIWVILRILYFSIILLEILLNYNIIEKILEIKKVNGTYYDDWGKASSFIIKFITWVSIYLLITI